MAEMTTVARPYARAAFEYAQAEQGGLKTWSELLAAASNVAADASVQALIGSPSLSAADKAALVLEVSGEAAARAAGAENFGNFVRLLAENNRLAALSEIAALFEALKAEAERTLHAEVISAFEVTEPQREKLAAALKQRFDRDVVLECRVDESLIGGAIIRAGDVVIDGSARGGLAELATALRQ